MVDNIRYYNFDIELIKKSVAAAILISFGVCINLTIGGIAGAILFSFGLLGVCALKLNLFTGKAGYIFDSKENKKEILPIIIINLIAGWLFGATLSYCCYCYNGGNGIYNFKSICFANLYFWKYNGKFVY